jgi:hypothetical protein
MASLLDSSCFVIMTLRQVYSLMWGVIWMKIPSMSRFLIETKLFTTSTRTILAPQWTKGPTRMKGSVGHVPLRVTEVYWVATTGTWVSFQGNSKSYSKKYLSPTQKVRNEPLKANNNNEVLMENNVRILCLTRNRFKKCFNNSSSNSCSTNNYSLTINLKRSQLNWTERTQYLVG